MRTSDGHALEDVADARAATRPGRARRRRTRPAAARCAATGPRARRGRGRSPGRRRCGPGAWAATASVSSSASSRRSIGHCARAASIPTTRPRTGPEQLGAADGQRRLVDGRASRAHAAASGARGRARRPCAPRSARGRWCPAPARRRASRSAAGRGRGPGESGRGRIPRPSSETTTVSAPSVRPARDAHGTVAVGVGMHHDVGAGLGDRQLDVRQRVVGHVEGVAEPAEGMPDDGHVLGACRQGQLEVGRRRLLVAVVPGHPSPGVLIGWHMPTRSSSYSRLRGPARREAAGEHRRSQPSGRGGRGPSVSTPGRPEGGPTRVGEVIASRRGRVRRCP